MRWEIDGKWLVAGTEAGEFVVRRFPESFQFQAGWWPAGTGDMVHIGMYRTEGAAKGAAKRYAKKMAAAFKAMGKAGWQ